MDDEETLRMWRKIRGLREDTVIDNYSSKCLIKLAEQARADERKKLMRELIAEMDEIDKNDNTFSKKWRIPTIIHWLRCKTKKKEEKSEHQPQYKKVK